MPLRILSVIAALLGAAVLNAQPQPLPAATNTDPTAKVIPLPSPAKPELPSLFLIGDSTVRNGRDDGQGKGAAGQWGWGNPIADYFDTARINVVNRAIGGLSSRTYLTAGHWERTLALVKAGDFVMIQFGHNDNGPVNDDKRARGTLRGSGDESEEIDNMITKRHEVVHTYGWYLRKYITDIKARGATPVLCSLVPRKTWDEAGKIVRNRDSYAGWAAEVAKQEKIGFIDLNESIARAYDKLGHDEVMKLFPLVTPDEHTHTNMAGAQLNARCVIAGLKALSRHPLLAFLNAKAGDIPAVDLSKPATEDDRPILDASKIPEEKPQDGSLPSLFLVGDSTVKSGGAKGAIGWGERIAPYFDPKKINVVNHAIGGRSSRTFFTEGRWDKVLAQLKAGDIVLVQFGHNDLGRIGEPQFKRRPSGRGIGPETADDPRPDGTVEKVQTFGWYMARYVNDAKAKGASVVLCAPVPHKDAWQTGRDFAQVAEWNREVARLNGARFLDLTMVITAAYKEVGAEKVNTFFADARTHTNETGADFNAACVVAGLRTLEGDPVAPYLSEKGRAVAPAKIATPAP